MENLNDYFKGKVIKSIEATENGCKIEFDAEKFVPVDGDFVTIITEKGVSVCIHKNGKYSRSSIVYVYADILYDGSLFIGTPMGNSPSLITVRQSTKQEVNRLLDALKADGKTWNASKLRVEKLRWRNVKGGEYWFSNCNPENGIAVFFPASEIDEYSTFDNAQYECGDYSKTEEECQSICDELNAVLEKRKNI